MLDWFSSRRNRWRPYFTLLRLPFQFQLGPIFGWGFLLFGGRLDDGANILEMAWVFIAVHVGAFGGLTALNSFYDRDEGPVGGLWQPPPPPKYLCGFAWTVQLTGLAMLLLFDIWLAVIYALIVTLALGYSHPKLRWKSHPWKSVAVVIIGQGVLDFMAGAITAMRTGYSSPISSALWCGCLGAAAIVCAFYPLTQLFQIEDDQKHGHQTTAIELQQRFGPSGPFRWAQGLLAIGAFLNVGALTLARHAGWLMIALLLVGLSGCLWTIELWRRDYTRRQSQTTNPATSFDSRALDFSIVHRLFGASSLLFAILILALLWDGRRG